MARIPRQLWPPAIWNRLATGEYRQLYWICWAYYSC